MNETVQEALNDQIRNELYAAYLYLSMAGWFESRNLPGFAHWMRIQREEEVGHAMRLFDYVHERGGRARLKALDEPPAEFDSPLDVMEHALEHERGVTSRIHELYETAMHEKDYPTQTILQWFVTEQVEEEATATRLVEQLRLAGNDGAAILLLDRELGGRTGEE